MNDFELNALLKQVPPPARTAEYWEDFPRRVRVRSRTARLAEPPRPQPLIQLWAGGLACASVLILLVWGGAHQFRQVFTPSLQRDLAQLPTNLKTFMLDEHGQQKLVTDPNSDPQ